MYAMRPAIAEQNKPAGGDNNEGDALAFDSKALPTGTAASNLSRIYGTSKLGDLVDNEITLKAETQDFIMN